LNSKLDSMKFETHLAYHIAIAYDRQTGEKAYNQYHLQLAALSLQFMHINRRTMPNHHPCTHALLPNYVTSKTKTEHENRFWSFPKPKNRFYKRNPVLETYSIWAVHELRKSRSHVRFNLFLYCNSLSPLRSIVFLQLSLTAPLHPISARSAPTIKFRISRTNGG